MNTKKKILKEIEDLVRKIYFKETGEILENFSVNDLYADYNSLHIAYSYKEIASTKDVFLEHIVADVVRSY